MGKGWVFRRRKGFWCGSFGRNGSRVHWT
jgi:hypothetical protein